MHVSVQAALLRRARDFAGGVSFLARIFQVSAYDLDDMLHGKAPVPPWLFLRAVDYVNDMEQKRIVAPPVHGSGFEDISVDRER